MSGIGEATIRIRGGMILTVPLDKETPVRADIYMGGQPAFARQVEKHRIPPLPPSEEGTRLIAR